MPLFWIGFLVSIVIITAIYGILFWAKFQVNNITLSGNEKIPSEDIKNVAWDSVNQNVFSKRIIIADIGKIKKDILKAFPAIENLTVQKKYPQDILLTVQERKPFNALCASESTDNKKCFLIDENGVAYQNLEYVPDQMFIITLKDNKEIILGKEVIEKNIVDMIAKISQQLKNNFGVEIKNVSVSDILVVTTSENWQIYFNTTFDINLQILKMNALLKDEISPETRKNLQYIYLQYKDRAYYK